MFLYEQECLYNVDVVLIETDRQREARHTHTHTHIITQVSL